MPWDADVHIQRQNETVLLVLNLWCNIHFIIYKSENHDMNRQTTVLVRMSFSINYHLIIHGIAPLKVVLNNVMMKSISLWQKHRYDGYDREEVIGKIETKRVSTELPNENSWVCISSQLHGNYCYLKGEIHSFAYIFNVWKGANYYRPIRHKHFNEHPLRVGSLNDGIYSSI